jgi:hypothetical protein
MLEPVLSPVLEYVWWILSWLLDKLFGAIRVHIWLINITAGAYGGVGGAWMMHELNHNPIMIEHRRVMALVPQVLLRIIGIEI